MKKLKRKIEVLFFHLMAYPCYFFRRKKNTGTKVLIFAQGRSGSTLLEDLLCSTGHFRKNGEILGPQRNVKNPYRYLTGYTKIHPSLNFIFHLKIYHLTRDRKNKIDPTHFIQQLYAEGWKIVFLQRKNKLNHILSNVIAEKRNSYEKHDEKKENFSFSLDLDEVKRDIYERVKFEKEELKVLSNLEYIKIIYEEDLLDNNCHQNTINKILDFLNLERKTCSSTLKKINKKHPKDIIENYSDIAKLLTDIGMQDHLQ